MQIRVFLFSARIEGSTGRHAQADELRERRGWGVRLSRTTRSAAELEGTSEQGIDRTLEAGRL